MYKKIQLLITFFFLCFFYNISFAQINVAATGDQLYCPLSEINVATSFNISDTSGSDITEIFIQISTGYEVGTDFLKLTGTHPNITSSFSTSEGKLTLQTISSTPGNYTDLINAVKSVVFYSTLINPENEKHFSFTFGAANYLPSNGHFYEYISEEGITWTDAKAAAETKTYFGLQGYLVTITTPEEAQLAGKQATGTGWIGGSDAATEGVWKWVTGPENGIIFWNGLANGSTPNFAFWNNNEPNQSGDEDYAHITDPSIGIKGAWNDLSNTGATSGNYQPKGYIVEYGGMPGDPVLTISASTKISVASISSVTEATNCGSGSVTLSATPTAGTVFWYNALTGGVKIGEGINFITPIINTSTTYFALASVNGCDTGIRTAVTATIKPIPTITSTSSATTICYNENIVLNATSSAGEVNWYNSPTGGTSIATGTSFTTPNLTSNTTYYVDATFDGCTTTTRTPIAILVQNTAAPTGSAQQNFCDSENASLSNFNVLGNGILWYENAIGGSPLVSSTNLINNKTYYATQTVNGCESINRLAVQAKIYETPNPASAIPPIYKCDSNTTGTDIDGLELFDLTQNESFILNGKTATDFTISYFEDNAQSISITNPTNFPNSAVSQTIYFNIVNNNYTNCEASGSFTIEVNPLPVLKNTEVTLEQCDDDASNDGFSLFNLNEANELISANYQNEFFEFFEDAAYTQPISNPVAYQNPMVINSEVFVKVKSNFDCERFAKINLKVGATQIPPNFLLEYNTCETTPSNNQDGKAYFNFSDATQQLINTKPVFSSQLVRISYYETLDDALAEVNAISDISNYENTTPWEQKVYVRIDSDDVNACLGLNHVITLKVEPLPVANPVTINRQCDDDQDGFFGFDVSQVETTVLSGQTNVTVSYFDENNNPLPSPLPNPFVTKSQTITIRVTNNSSIVSPACFDETTLQFIVDDAPEVYPVTISPLCDNGTDTTDGIASFDTSTIETTLLGGQKNMEVTYFDENNNPLPSPLPNPFNTHTQSITATIRNPLNNACSISTTLNFVVNPLPYFEVEPEQIVCLNLLPKVLEVFNYSDTYSYRWFNENEQTISTNNTAEVTSAGIYTVIATSNLGCESLSRTISVTESVVATISYEDITVIDDSENNTISINNKNNNLGIGDYEFALDDDFGPYQDEPFFENVTPGIHTVYVRDKNSCGVAQIEVSVIGYPKFFTPNNDGYNDYWTVLGFREDFYPTSQFYIFDRFGKVVATLSPNSQGWDGTYNGKLLPATDYWFSVQLIDINGVVRNKKGHFSLIRR